MIFFWGWGKQQAEHQVGPTERVVLVFSYFHFWWIFRVAWGREYFAATWTEAGWAVAPISADDAFQRCLGAPPEIPMWQRYSLLWGAGALALLIAFVGIFSLLAT